MRAVLYVRISDDREGSGLGVARQEADCRALCEREGWTVADVLVDNDRSAYSGRRRPAYEQLLDGLKAGRWRMVVAWHPDRLHRSPRELEAFIDVLEAASAKVRTVTAGELDLSTATGRMTARVVGAVARHESEHKAERQRRKHRELAEAGRDVGGGRAFGWIDRKVLHPSEAAMIRDAIQAVLDGRSLRSIAVGWQAKVPPPKGKRWTTFSIRRIVTSPRVAGLRSYGGKLYPAEWEPVVDEFTWRRVCSVLADPRRRTRTSTRAYLLTGGVAVCALCGASLVARPKDGRRSYVCASGPNFAGCGKIRVQADPFEQDVSGRVSAAIAKGRIPVEQGTSETVAAIEAAERSLAELADDCYVHRTVTKDQFNSASGLLRAKLDALRSELGRLESWQPVDVADWPTAPPERRRLIVARMVERVVVGPAVKGRNTYDHRRVQVIWRR